MSPGDDRDRIFGDAVLRFHVPQRGPGCRLYQRDGVNEWRLVGKFGSVEEAERHADVVFGRERRGRR